MRFEDEHLRGGEGDLTTTDLSEGTEKEVSFPPTVPDNPAMSKQLRV